MSMGRIVGISLMVMEGCLILELDVEFRVRSSGANASVHVTTVEYCCQQPLLRQALVAKAKFC